ncbi:hypothetical protein A2U01_0088219 [Trifolium medium]|uniref:Uncharacterized protein n=1 Tax=Trifolium medium TaxID=97028 RepID=A0A392U0M4_9FABA|nr:hypothetical protein [Trifolium medium]
MLYRVNGLGSCSGMLVQSVGGGGKTFGAAMAKGG